MKTALVNPFFISNATKFTRSSLVFFSSPAANQDIWLRHYAQNFAIYYRGMFKATQTNENIYCVVTRDDKDYRRRFLEDNFHVLLEDANKITILLQRGKTFTTGTV